MIEHQLCIIWYLGSIHGEYPEGISLGRFEGGKSISLEHFLRGEVGSSCNSCN